MFNTGLELDPKELLEHIKASISVAVGGFVLPFSIGSITVRWFGGTIYQSLFVGMGLSISAIALQSVILHSMRINKSEIGHIIKGEPLLTLEQSSGLVFMAFVTTLIAPVVLKWIAIRTCLHVENAEFCNLWDDSRSS